MTTPPTSTPWVPLWPLSQPVPVGTELGYVEKTSNTNITATTLATAQTIITLPALNFDGLTPVWLEFYSSLVQLPTTAGFYTYIYLFDGANEIGVIATNQNPSSSSMGSPTIGRRKLTPSAGAHTYSARAHNGAAGTTVITGGPGGAGSGVAVPAYLRAERA